MSKPPERPRRPMGTLERAEAAFKSATTKPEAEPQGKASPNAGAVPTAKELVSLRIDRDILEYFQEDGPGWQDRMNDALGKIVRAAKDE
ncbi:MAG: hypothetical protein JWN11_1671 [Hyphomicrobiales bacterium]|nr:hypothetical protein [Hyphomicrobiales bacterium]